MLDGVARQWVRDVKPVLDEYDTIYSKVYTV